MLKYPNFKILIYTIILIFIVSCAKKEKAFNNVNSHEKEIILESNINFKSVAFLNDTNKKIIEIASIAFNNSKELNESKVILKNTFIRN